VRFCYDSSHDWLWGRPRLGTLRRWRHRLAQTHFSDAGDDDEDRHLLPRSGRIDWDAVAEAFPAQTYAGVLLLEVIAGSPSEPPEQFLAQAHRQLTWLAARLGQGGPTEGSPRDISA
jgi:sugar phosphate isomerase/epimerase